MALLLCSRQSCISFCDLSSSLSESFCFLARKPVAAQPSGEVAQEACKSGTHRIACNKRRTNFCQRRDAMVADVAVNRVGDCLFDEHQESCDSASHGSMGCKFH